MKTILKDFDSLTKEELYEILTLRNQVFVLEQKCPYQEIDGKDIEALHLMMYDEDLIGYLRILKAGLSFKEASIGRVLLKESHRKRSLGKALMQEAINFMTDNQMLPIKISAQAYLIKFYETMGFVVCTPEYLEDDIPHIGMKYEK